MKILMRESRLGAANALGSRTRLYRRGETYELPEGWGAALAVAFVAAGWAESPEASVDPASEPAGLADPPARRRPRPGSRQKRGRRARR